MTKKGDKCPHGQDGESWGQPWSPRRGFVYDAEVILATKVRCLICGKALSTKGWLP